MAAAKKTARGRASAKSPGKPKSAKPSRKIRIRLDLTDEMPSYYVNHLELGYSMYEFALNAAKTPTVLAGSARDLAQTTGELLVRPELQLVFPPRTAKALIDVLEKQVAAYETQFGQIDSRKADDE